MNIIKNAFRYIAQAVLAADAGEKKEIIKTSIGGQALIEGIMMRGPEKTACVVRKTDGETAKKVTPTQAPSKKHPILAWPLIRGCVGLVTSLRIGYDALEYSASFFDDEQSGEEPSRLERWLSDKFGDRLMKYVTVLSAVLGVALSIGLFVLLPTVIAGWLSPFTGASGGPLRSLLEGLLRIAIFLCYLWAISLMPDIKRVFMYHGAEHKTIACYEHGEELTVENVKKYRRFHPRCGTSFLLIIMVVSILVFSLLRWDGVWMRMLMRILLLPVVVGISYELIKFAGRHDNLLTRIISAPGLWLQRLTTDEPDDSMMECAIEALNEVIPEKEGADRW